MDTRPAEIGDEGVLLEAVSQILAQQNLDAAEVDEAEVVFGVVLVAGEDAPEVLQPGVEAFYLPAAAVATKDSAILGGGLFASPAMGSNHLDALGGKLLIERIAVVGFVTDQTLGRLSNETRFQSCRDKGDFSRASTRCVGGERKTSSVCQHHELRAFAPLGGTHGCPPFFATMNVPSMKHSLRSIWPRWRKSSAKTSRMSRNAPERTHPW